MFLKLQIMPAVSYVFEATNNAFGLICYLKLQITPVDSYVF